MNVLLLLILQILRVNACGCACAQLAAVNSRAPPRSANLSFHSKHKVEWREKKRKKSLQRYFFIPTQSRLRPVPFSQRAFCLWSVFLFLLSMLHSASIINGGMNGDLKGEKKPAGFKKKKKKILFPRVLQGRGHTVKVGRGVQSYCPCFLCPYPSNAPQEVHLVDGHQPQTHRRMGTQARARTHTHARPICLPGLVSGSPIYNQWQVYI